MSILLLFNDLPDSQLIGHNQLYFLTFFQSFFVNHLYIKSMKNTVRTDEIFSPIHGNDCKFCFSSSNHIPSIISLTLLARSVLFFSNLFISTI